MRLPTLAAVSLAGLLVFGVAACGESKKRDAAPPTPRPIPSLVKIADEPQGIALATIYIYFYHMNVVYSVGFYEIVN